MTKMERPLSPKRGEFWPDDVIVEILSWLPVISLLRFKSVCKLWHTIIHDPNFIKKHRSQSKCHHVCEGKSKSNGNEERFKSRNSINGLVLEISEKTGKYRIRNPLTKQVLELLDVPEEEGVCRPYMYMGFDSSTNNYKLYYMYRKKGTNEYFRIKTLTVGVDLVWRPIDISLSQDNIAIINWARSEEANYLINWCTNEMDKVDIIRYNFKDDSFMRIKIPWGSRKDGYKFRWFIWDEKLSLGFITGEELHVWVLEDFNKQIWSEKKIILLDFMKPYLRSVVRVKAAFLASVLNVSSYRIQYDIESKKYKYIFKPSAYKPISYSIIPSLVSIQGMHSEDGNSSMHLSSPDYVMVEGQL